MEVLPLRTQASVKVSRLMKGRTWRSKTVKGRAELQEGGALRGVGTTARMRSVREGHGSSGGTVS